MIAVLIRIMNTHCCVFENIEGSSEELDRPRLLPELTLLALEAVLPLPAQSKDDMLRIYPVTLY